MLKLSKYPPKGFTLIELLVVVLIIGSLAAIALPQYQIAVGKAKFAELKILTKGIQEGAQQYYLIYGNYDGILEDNSNLDIEIPEGSNCYIWRNSYDMIECHKEIFGTGMRYYVSRSTGAPSHCLAYSANTNDLANRLCQNETDKPASSAICKDEDGGYCKYLY